MLQVGSHLLVVGCAVAPLQQHTLHLVCSLAHQLVALLAFGHGLELLEDFSHELAVVAHGYIRHGIAHRLGLGGYRCSLCHVVGIVDVELELAHQSQVVPQLLLVVGQLAVLRIHSVHYADNRRGTPLALALCGQRDDKVYHLLHLTTVFGHEELLALGVVV